MVLWSSSPSCSSFEASKDDFESNATCMNIRDDNIMCNGRGVESLSACVTLCLCIREPNASNLHPFFSHFVCFHHTELLFLLYLQVRREYYSHQINTKFIKVTFLYLNKIALYPCLKD